MWNYVWSSGLELQHLYARDMWYRPGREIQKTGLYKIMLTEATPRIGISSGPPGTAQKSAQIIQTITHECVTMADQRVSSPFSCAGFVFVYQILGADQAGWNFSHFAVSFSCTKYTDTKKNSAEQNTAPSRSQKLKLFGGTKAQTLVTNQFPRQPDTNMKKLHRKDSIPISVDGLATLLHTTCWDRSA